MNRPHENGFVFRQNVNENKRKYAFLINKQEDRKLRYEQHFKQKTVNKYLKKNYVEQRRLSAFKTQHENYLK